MSRREQTVRLSIRTKIVLVSVLVEATMLALLLFNSLRLLDQALEGHVQARVEATGPLLNASLAARLFERDFGSIREIINGLANSRHEDFRYLAVYDERERLYAMAGRVDPARMPSQDADVYSALSDLVYDTAVPITLGPERVGEVRYGLSLAAFVASRDSLFRQGLAIAGAEILLSMLLLGFAGVLLTRHVRELVAATRRVAAGDYGARIAIGSRDEIALLADNFNTMAEAVRSRIEALHASERALAEEKERAVVTLHSIGDGVITTDLAGYVQYLNPAAEHLVGVSFEAARDRPVRDIYQTLDEATRGSIECVLERALREQRVVTRQGRALLVGPRGREYAVEETASPIRDRDMNIVGGVLVFRDVTETREFARRLKFQAMHDNLTGLVNRQEFERRAADALADARRLGEPHALLYVDLDQFKVVNDTCGHSAGDELLRRLARVIRTQVRDADVVARLGGDEFGVLARGCRPDTALAIAEGLRAAIQRFRFAWGDRVFELGASIGVVPMGPETEDLTEVFTAADIACYIAKDKGRNQVHLHQPDDLEQARRRGEMQWSADLISALGEDRLALYFQRIYPLQHPGRRSTMCELLVRLIDRDGEIVAPARFLPAAERFQQGMALDRWVIHHALAALGRRQPACRGTFNINLSGQSLGHADFLDFVKAEIRMNRIAPHRLCFEVTETAAITSLQRAHRFMAELRTLGCRFALDDFGSGLSSFAYLQALPVDFLKIDGSFVRHIARNASDRALVTAIHQIGHSLGVRTIAELIEDDETAALLREIGVDYGQGFRLHAPEPLLASTQRATGQFA